MSTSPRVLLHRLMNTWESASLDARDAFPFQHLLKEILFHCDIRFHEYSPEQGAPFPKRLLRWLQNVQSTSEQQLLFRMLQWLVFVDPRQMRSLYRDAYRRIVTPWITRSMSADEHASADFEERLRKLLRTVQFLSITASFKYVDFRNANALTGLGQNLLLGETPHLISAACSTIPKSCVAVIVLEDFVGRGKQASKVLAMVRRQITLPMLFVPIMALEEGVSRLRNRKDLSDVDIEPALMVPTSLSLTRESQPGEPEEFPYFRSLVKSTRRRVLQPLDEQDDSPTDEFGYEGSGAFIVPVHNAPNNTLPLIHHKAPSWEPLFRRIHHKKN